MTLLLGRASTGRARGSWGSRWGMIKSHGRPAASSRQCPMGYTGIVSPGVLRSFRIAVAVLAWSWAWPGEVKCAELATGRIGGQTAGGLELWVGGWNTHNVLRLDWQTGESLGFFVPSGAGGLSRAHTFSFGPDDDLYVASYGTSSILRYDGRTGDFIDQFVGPGDGLVSAHTAFWNADGTLLVSSEGGDRVNQYDGGSGAFLRAFVSPGEAGLDGPELIITGPDGFLYLSAQSAQVLRIDSEQGGVVDVFVGDDPQTPEDETGGLTWAHGMAFGPYDGNLYVASSQNHRILRYDGETGVFMDIFIGTTINFPIGIQFGPDGHLYVASHSTSRIHRFDGTSGALLGQVADLAPLGLSGPLDIQFMTPRSAVPATSEWGSVVLALSILCAASIVVRGSLSNQLF